MARSGASAIVSVVLWLFASTAFAVTFTVDSTVDLPDASPGDGACAAAGGACTLRAAVQEANALRPGREVPGPDTVVLPAGVYNLTIQANGTGYLWVTDDIEIIGEGPSLTIIDGNHVDRIIAGEILTTARESLIVRGVTLRNGGRPDVVGGGVFHTGMLRFEDVVVRDCVADIGGGIYGHGTLVRTVVTGNVADACCAGIRAAVELVLIDSTVSDNHTSDGSGGGVFGYGHFTMSAIRSTISGNSAGTHGGGLYLMGEGTTLVDSTVSGNRADRDGGGIYRTGSYNPGSGVFPTGRVQLWNTTVADNVADADADGSGNGGGVASQNGGGIYLRNTILARNVDMGGEAPDCAAELWSEGHNLVETMASCSFANEGWDDLLDVPAMLGPLAPNGGPTETHALLPGSPALNWGNPFIPGTGAESCSPVDQRGVPRPQGSRCDTGAYEADVATCDAPRVGCTPALPRGSSLKLRRSPARLGWKWKGAGIAPSAFGNSNASTGYALCVFDALTGAPVPALEALVPPGPCPIRPCWKDVSGGVTYRNRAGTPSGVEGFKAKAAATGKGTISVKALGDALAVPPLPLAQDPAVVVQLGRVGGDECWEARFGTSARNDAGTYAARSD